MIEKNKNWMLISIGSLLLSIVSLLFPIIYYTAGQGADVGKRYAFNIISLIDNHKFIQCVFSEYRGYVLIAISESLGMLLICLLCVVGIAAIVLSVVGLKSMSKQYESAWPFRLTMAGIICTVVPSLAILIAVLMSGNGFLGIIQVGPYVYITPIAMVISCVTVIKRHKLSREELQIQKVAGEYIRPAGDLPLQ